MKIQSIMNIRQLIILKYMINNTIKSSTTINECGNRAFNSKFFIRDKKVVKYKDFGLNRGIHCYIMKILKKVLTK